MSAETELIWAREVQEKMIQKVRAAVKRNRGKIPYLSVNGRFDDWSGERVGWWTNGFWEAELLQLYKASKDPLFLTAAEETENLLKEVLMQYLPMDHDSGFRFLISAVAHYRLTGNLDSRNYGILAAGNLAGRFNLAANLIRAWNDPGDGKTADLAIIDCMMNLPLLYWASGELKDPRFKQIAMAHADQAIKAFVRENGSVNHIVKFDPETGELKGPQDGQGMSPESAWTRGQSWALYGFTLSYLHTKEERYLKTAKKVASYLLSVIPQDGLIPVDFDQPENVDYEDDTAAAIFACGFLELEKCVEGREASDYHEMALKLLHALDEKRSDWDHETDPILTRCTAAYHDQNHNFSMMYADYYYIEAITKLTGDGAFFW